MGEETNDPAGKGGAGVQLGGEPGSYSKTASEKQGRKAAGESVTYQRVTGDIGPVSVLAKRGCPPPAVVVERHQHKALVYYSSPPWGWGAQLGEFLDPGSPAVLRYAQRLALKLREAALVEQGRRIRNRELAKREREALLATRRDGCR
jgi:hypothetical protein